MEERRLLKVKTEKKEETPTIVLYDELQRAFDHFNKTLFMDEFSVELHQCVITLSSHNPAMKGYQCKGKFIDDKGMEVDELSLNPQWFAAQGLDLYCQ